MKKIIMIILCLLLTACTDRHIVVVESTEYGPPATEEFDGELDMEQLHLDVSDIVYSDEFPDVAAFYFDLNQETGKMYLDVVANDETEIGRVLEAVNSIIKVINDCAAVQNPEYAISADKYYGGLFDQIDINLRVYYEKEYPDGQYIVKDVLENGLYVEYEN